MKTELVPKGSRKEAVEFIQENFQIKGTITHLHTMMKEVTKKEFNAANVHAACNCVKQLNDTINTSMSAAKFVAEQYER